MGAAFHVQPWKEYQRVAILYQYGQGTLVTKVEEDELPCLLNFLTFILLYSSSLQVQWLDGKYVVFGMILEGEEVVGKIEEYGQFGGTPTAEVVISDCGVMDLEPEDKETHYVTEWK